ncbi:MAG: TonB-dependent receptor [Flavobacteriaceae bacterium]|nr:TonB-dependent receptor [Flavobacteriaceae bacterium]
MSRFYHFILITFFCATPLYAQLDSIQELKEVLILDSKLNEYASGYKLTKISDTLIERNSASLTDVLRLNSTIYFKENGYGMVSSPSFRGTNAAQTAVIWNGININSNLTGQTDFNTISINSFNNIIIRSGGGSTQYGSGAVGGSIHLNNDLVFKKQHKNDLNIGYGSFSTLLGNFKTVQSNEKKYFDLGIDFIDSENDYDFINLDQKNENGEFSRLNISANAGSKTKKGFLSWNSNYFVSDRNFSGSITAPSNDNYKDITTRNLVSWKTNRNKLSSTLKVAHLFERYRYSPNKEKEFFFEGKSNTFIGDYLLEYNLLDNLKISSVLNYTYINSEGSNIGNNDRNTLAAVFLLKHQVSKKLSYGLNLRQEFLNEFKNPFLVAFDVSYQLLNWYSVTLNGSKNYRVPTFNDLFWDAGGNKNLQPETSYQADFGNKFTWKNFQFQLNAFYITSTNLIKWQPSDSGLWMPINISEAENYGAEVSANYLIAFKEHQFSTSINYAYTSAIDKEKDKQLIYVPYHKTTSLLNYTFNNISAYYQLLYNGTVFTTTDNLGIVEAYSVSNFGIDYTFQKNKFPIKIGIKLNNIFNKYYENVAYRPMPNRNFQTFINFKF